MEIINSVVEDTAKLKKTFALNSNILGNSNVGRSCVISSTITGNASVGDDCTINNSIIAYNAVIGNHVYVSTGSFIGGDAHIGGSDIIGIICDSYIGGRALINNQDCYETFSFDILGDCETLNNNILTTDVERNNKITIYEEEDGSIGMGSFIRCTIGKPNDVLRVMYQYLLTLMSTDDAIKRMKILEKEINSKVDDFITKRKKQKELNNAG